ncbi:DUF6950 family protein [Citrobacter koseri]|uniref:DUF6950 family protein n=1 Tax=Citrobacter koseri TaxID=545 RepID=UPI0019044D3C|nr:ornithine carbamoyltransferase [Citrobacter koseri]EKX8764821.1 ornithine carbamoyltransferase [Citrobacter koseri]MBJ9355229.1 ornithine carbamoyltransferase [Citrobacter koseri]MBJ9648158.1 ornithine carbamoyltransferase [Citrobacter koseri]
MSFKKSNQLYDICNNALSTEYKFGNNDCNIICLRAIDLYCSTEWVDIAQYDSVIAGVKQLNELGFKSTQEIILQYADETQFPIDGDIWMDSDNPLLMGIVFSGRLLGVNEEHTKFQLNPLRNDGKYYRIRKVKWDLQEMEFLER